jgi:hypothetical protein
MLYILFYLLHKNLLVNHIFIYLLPMYQISIHVSKNLFLLNFFHVLHLLKNLIYLLDIKFSII